jgi:GT2 family glycosyltransferase
MNVKHLELTHLTDVLDRAEILAPQPNFVEVQAFTIDDACKFCVFQHPNSRILWPEMLLGANSSLATHLGIKPIVWEKVQAAVSFKIEVHDSSGGVTTLFEHEVDVRTKADRHWHACELSLVAWQGQTVRLCFTTHVESGRTALAWSGWGDPTVSHSALAPRPMAKPVVLLPKASKNCAPLVLLITCDALRKDHLSTYGNSPVQTPCLDALGADGIVIENARSNSDVTLGAYTSLLAGKMPHETGVVSEWGEYPTHLPSLPQCFAAAGYRTVFAPSELEISDESSQLRSLFLEHVPALGNPAQQSGLTSRRFLRHLKENPPTTESPVFAWLQLFEPHPPSLPESRFVQPLYPKDPRAAENALRTNILGDLHGVETVHVFSIDWPDWTTPMPGPIFERLWATGQELANGGVGGPDLARHIVSIGPTAMNGLSSKEFGRWLLRELLPTTEATPPGTVTPALADWLANVFEKLRMIDLDLLAHMEGVVDWRYPLALYAASVASVDAAVGNVVAQLKEANLYDDAVILFTSPHGEGLGSRDRGFMHHHLLQETVLDIPALLKLPRSTHPASAGQRSRAGLQTIEMGATLLAAACCEVPWVFPREQNKLPSILAGEESTALIASVGMQAMNSCVVDGTYKLVRSHGGWESSATGAYRGSRKVYAEYDEPMELPQDVFERLKAFLHTVVPPQAQDWLARLPSSLPLGFSEQAALQDSVSTGMALLEEKARRLEIQLKERTKENEFLHKQVVTGVKRLSEVHSIMAQMVASRRWKLANLLRRSGVYQPLEKCLAKAKQWMVDARPSMERLSQGSDKYPQWLLRRRPPNSKAISVTGFRIGIVVAVTPDTRTEYLSKALQSLENQHYKDWQAWIVGAPYSEKADPRLHFVDSLGANLPTGPTHWAFVGAEDELEPHALAEIANLASDETFCYTDEDEISDGGKVSNPFLKPVWSPELFEAMPFTGALAVIATRLLEQLPKPTDLLSQELASELAWRASEHPEFRPCRVPKVLYHKRQQTPRQRKNQTHLDLLALQASLDRRGELAQACVQSDGRTFRVQRLILGSPKVSILIPTRNQAGLLARCLASLKSMTQYTNYEVVILDNESNEPEAQQLLASCGHRIIKVPGPFNYAAMNNIGVRSTDGDLVLLLNNDTEILEPNWLGAMIEHAQRPEVGAVGAKLLYPDRTTQHAGVILGIQGRASHAFAGADPAASIARRQLQVTRNYSAVTAACLLMRREVYQQLNGFDEERFKVAYNDVDLCVRALKLGYRNVLTPHAVLKHHECASRPRVDNPHEVALLQAQCFGREADWTDPFYHPLLNQNSADFQIAY